MSRRQQWFWTAALGLHLFLILAAASEDFSSTLGNAESLLPATFVPLLNRTATIASLALGKKLKVSNPLRQLLACYANGAGIEVGYSYFAPNVPPNSKLVFELHYPDGRVEYDLPVVGGAAAGYRVATLLDHLSAFHYAPLREAIVKTLVLSIHKEHPEAAMIRAIFGVANLTSAAEYRSGKRITYQTVADYKFRVQPKLSQRAPP